MAMIPQVRYPTQFPLAEAQCVFGYLRGSEENDLACTLECGWNVAGFGLSFIGHDHPPLVGSHGDLTACTDEELAAKLEDCCTQSQVAMATPAALPAWAFLLIEVAFEIIRRLRDR